MAKDEIVVLYASQTGQAETIAETIHEAAEEHEIKSTLLCLQKAEESFKLISETNVPVIFVCSTTGDGEPPSNARKLIRMLQRRTLETNHLSSLRYALLGLGDSNYSTFCGGPKTLQRTLKKLSAQSYYNAGFADDGTDLEIVVEPWIEGLWPALKSHLRSRCNLNEISPQEAGNKICEKLENIDISADVGKDGEIILEDEQDILHKIIDMNTDSPLHNLSDSFEGKLPPAMQRYLTHVFVDDYVKLSKVPCVPYPLSIDDIFHSVEVASIDKLTTDNAVKTALCVTLNVANDFSYEPGDSFGVFLQNPKKEVDWLIKRLKIDSICDKTIEIKIDSDSKKKKVPNFIPKLCTIRYIFENCLEIRSVPKRTLFRSLIDYTTSESDCNILRRLCCKESMNDYIKFVRTPNSNILDILATLSTCQPPFELLIENLPRLKARLYSVASCPLVTPGELRFAFNVIEFDPIDGRMYKRQGLCTGYLQSLADNLPIPADNLPKLTIFKTKNESFRLHKDISKPIIMIGPGTGVAPFLGFLKRLQTQNDNLIETWLFFGCRHKDHDFLFERELNSNVESGVLHHLVTSFSRDLAPLGDANPKYVQDNLKLYSSQIFNLLMHQEATVYVCGDALNMAKDVRDAMIEILCEKMSLDLARETHKKLIKEGRYKEDVWT